MRDNDRLLIFRPGALGDVILALPAVRQLRRAWPAGHFTWVGYAQHLEWLKLTGLLDAWRSIDDALFRHLYTGDPDGTLRDYLRGFDYCVAWLQDREGCLGELFQSCFPGRWVMAPPFPERGSGEHASDHLLATVAHWTGKPAPAETGNRWPYAPEGLEDGDRHWDLVIHPGSGSRLKCWPLERFQAAALELRARYEWRILWLLGPAEEDLEPQVRSFCTAWGMDGAVHQRVAEILPLLGAARRFLGNDSGITHLAAFLGLETVALMGPTCPREWAPQGARIVTHHQAVPCRPCSESERKACPDRFCLTGITIAQVVDSFSIQPEEASCEERTWR